MHETAQDLAGLQDLLDRSMAGAGPHLRDIINEPRRIDARGLAEWLTGMRLLVLATTTADGRPLAGPVDGIFYRGAFHFSTGADAVRLRHIRARPHVSATHLPGEERAVTVHGRASVLDLRAEAQSGLRQCLLDVYLPRMPDYEQFIDSGPVVVRIDAEKMFSFRLEPVSAGEA